MPPFEYFYVFKVFIDGDNENRMDYEENLRQTLRGLLEDRRLAPLIFNYASFQIIPKTAGSSVISSRRKQGNGGFGYGGEDRRAE